jgi:hypothetical protein
MIAHVRMLGLLLGVGMALVQGTAAQSVTDTVSRWGLIGTWALDCTKPANVRGAKVAHERDFGDRRDSNDVQQARTGVGGTLDLVVHFPGLNQARKFTMLMASDRRIRALANSRTDGTEETIKDGRFTANGGVTPWQTRCR